MKALGWGIALLAVLLTAALAVQLLRSGPATTTDVSIQPAEETTEHWLRQGPGRIEGHAVRVEVLLPLAYEVPKGQLVIEHELPTGDYDITLQTARGNESYALREALESEFGWGAIRISQPRDVYVLRTLPNRPRPEAMTRPPRDSHSKLSVCRGELTGEALSSQDLASHFSTLIGRPVLDETGIEELYTVDLDWEPRNTQALLTEVKERLGLDLAPERRTVDVVVIRSEDTP